MKQSTLCYSLMLAAGLAAAGCTTSTPAPQAAAPAPVVLADKDATHVLTADEPYYESGPGTGASAGTLKAGTKVLMMIPTADYSKVEIPTGATVYVKTASLKPLGK